MKNLLLFIFLFISHFSLSQNLVNNWSFEDTISCPVGFGDITKSVGWSSFKETPDYFNSCNTDTIGTSFVGIPNNFFGFQLAHSGNAFTGLYVYYGITSNYRELIGSQLNQTMIVGQKYFASFFVSHTYSQYAPYLNGSIKKIGLRFSTISYSYNSPLLIDNISQIYSDSIISDTLNWFKVSGAFIADSAYQFISIGNFYNDSSTMYIPHDSISFAAYYYIDDVKVSTDSNFVNTSIKQYTNNLIKVFPNPARDWIVLEGKGIKSVEILNALGSEIGSYPTTAFTLRHQINLGSLSCGIYFLKVNMIDDKFHFQKIIVQY